jgi:hypothetical protein
MDPNYDYRERCVELAEYILKNNVADRYTGTLPNFDTTRTICS